MFNSKKFQFIFFSVLLAQSIYFSCSADAIHDASKEGDLQEIKKEIEKGTPVDLFSDDSKQKTSLQICCENYFHSLLKSWKNLKTSPQEYRKCIEYLIKNGANPTFALFSIFIEEISNCTSETTIKKMLNFIEFLIKQGANVNEQGENIYPIKEVNGCYDQGFDFIGTPLHNATQVRGSEKFAELLIKHGANVNAVSREGYTPIVTTSNPKTVDLLVKNGADVNDRCKQFGWTALHVFCHYHEGTADTIEALLKNGANPNIKDNKNNTPLMIIANKELLKTARLLIEYGAKLSISTEEYEFSEIQIMFEYLTLTAFVEEDEKEVLKTLDFLTEKNLIVLNNFFNHKGETLFHHALRKVYNYDYLVCHLFTSKMFLDFLIKKISDIHVIEDTKKYSTYNGNLYDILTTNRIKKIRLSPTNLYCDLVTRYSKEKNLDRDKIKQETELEIRNMVKDKMEEKLLFYLKELIKRGASTIVQDKRGNTPLHIALIKDKSPKIVKFLIKNTPNTKIKNNKGYTPLDVTTMFNKTEYQKLLLLQ